ncbi:hypothetical protein V5O48_016453 [Marasmius crinis-equi]|uniref:Uncharacterized protein n=1 Tax=Marasmius crinis-equi TaxID=585013 RepID=A0ABR3ERR0_9AGAR
MEPRLVPLRKNREAFKKYCDDLAALASAQILQEYRDNPSFRRLLSYCSDHGYDLPERVKDTLRVIRERWDHGDGPSGRPPRTTIEVVEMAREMLAEEFGLEDGDSAGSEESNVAMTRPSRTEDQILASSRSDNAWDPARRLGDAWQTSRVRDANLSETPPFRPSSVPVASAAPSIALDDVRVQGVRSAQDSNTKTAEETKKDSEVMAGQESVLGLEIQGEETIVVGGDRVDVNEEEMGDGGERGLEKGDEQEGQEEVDEITETPGSGALDVSLEEYDYANPPIFPPKPAQWSPWLDDGQQVHFGWDNDAVVPLPVVREVYSCCLQFFKQNKKGHWKEVDRSSFFAKQQCKTCRRESRFCTPPKATDNFLSCIPCKTSKGKCSHNTLIPFVALAKKFRDRVSVVDLRLMLLSFHWVYEGDHEWCNNLFLSQPPFPHLPIRPRAMPVSHQPHSGSSPIGAITNATNGPSRSKVNHTRRRTHTPRTSPLRTSPTNAKRKAEVVGSKEVAKRMRITSPAEENKVEDQRRQVMEGVSHQSAGELMEDHLQNLKSPSQSMAVDGKVTVEPPCASVGRATTAPQRVRHSIPQRPRTSSTVHLLPKLTYPPKEPSLEIVENSVARPSYDKLARENKELKAQLVAARADRIFMTQSANKALKVSEAVSEMAQKASGLDNMIRQMAKSVIEYQWQDETPLEGVRPVLQEVQELRSEVFRLRERHVYLETRLQAARNDAAEEAKAEVTALKEEVKHLRELRSEYSKMLEDAIERGACLAFTSCHGFLPTLTSASKELVRSFYTLSEATKQLPTTEGKNMVDILRTFKDRSLQLRGMLDSLTTSFETNCNVDLVNSAQAFFLALGSSQLSKDPVEVEARSQNESWWKFTDADGRRFVPTLENDSFRVRLEREIQALKASSHFGNRDVWTPGMSAENQRDVEGVLNARDEASRGSFSRL